MNRKWSFLAMLFLIVPVLSAQSTKQTTAKPTPAKPAAPQLTWGPAPDVFPAAHSWRW